MKYLLTVVCIFCFLNSSSFADEAIDISLNQKEYSLGEDIEFAITLRDISQDISFIDIPGIEKFQVFSSQQTSSFQSINGEASSLKNYEYTLQPKSIGDYTLGPVAITLNGKERIDDTKLFFKITNISSENFTDNTVGGTEKGIDVDSQDTQLRGLRYMSFPLVGIISLLVFFIVSFFLILRLAFTKKYNKKHPIKLGAISSGDLYIQQEKYFVNLLKNIKTLDSQDFFKKYNLGIREVLYKIGEQSSHRATLKELKKSSVLQGRKELSLFEKSYRYEYSGEKVTCEIKETFIKDILSLLKK